MIDSDDSVQYIKDNVNLLIRKFVPSDKYTSTVAPVAMFMAGSPGAGKTEFSRSFLKGLEIENPERKYVRIDADEIRNIIPQYTGGNSDVVQRATSLGVQKVLDYVLKKDIDFLLDGTFAHYEVAQSNISRCLKHRRIIGIFYVYQDPLLAWEFTKRREALEGRTIPKEAFVEGYCNSIINVNRIKKEFGKKVQLDVIIKDYENKLSKMHHNVDKVDSFIKNEYTSLDLIDLLE